MDFIFIRSKKGTMDPIAVAVATQNAIAAFFNFLSTPAGQKWSEAVLQLDQQFNSKLADLFNKIHTQAMGAK